MCIEYSYIHRYYSESVTSLKTVTAACDWVTNKRHGVISTVEEYIKQHTVTFCIFRPWSNVMVVEVIK